MSLTVEMCLVQFPVHSLVPPVSIYFWVGVISGLCCMSIFDCNFNPKTGGVFYLSVPVNVPS